MKLLTRKGYLIEEQGMTYLAEADPETALAPLKRQPAPTALHSGPAPSRRGGSCSRGIRSAKAGDDK